MDTREKLIQIAEKLFIEKGYSQTSLEDILHQAELSKGGFYHYFASKEDILSEIIDRHVETMKQEVKNFLKHEDMNPLEKLKYWILRKKELSAPSERFFFSIFCDEKHLILREQFYQKVRKHILPVFVPLIEEGIEKKLFAPLHDPEKTLELLFGVQETLMSLDKSKIVHPQDIKLYEKVVLQIFERVLGLSDGTLIP